jgi:hypothetical protein
MRSHGELGATGTVGLAHQRGSVFFLHDDAMHIGRIRT